MSSLIKKKKNEREKMVIVLQRELPLSWGLEGKGTGLETKIYINLNNGLHPECKHCQKGLLRSTKLLVVQRNRETERESGNKEHSY